MGILIDELYYSLGLRADQLRSEAANVERAGDGMSQSMERATSTLEVLTAQLLRTPEGVRAVRDLLTQLSAATGEAASGMTVARSQTAGLDRQMRELAGQEAETAAETSALARPVDVVAARMGFAASGAAKWEEGLRRLTLQQQAAQVATQRQQAAAAAAGGTLQAVLLQQAGSAEFSNQALSKLRTGLVGLALQTTQTSGATGQLLQGLLLLGVGGGVVTGIAAGVAVIAAAWNRYTKEAREAKKATDELIEAAFKASKIGQREETDQNITAARQRVQELQDQLDQNARNVNVFGPRFGLPTEELDALTEALRRAKVALAELRGGAVELEEITVTSKSLAQIRTELTKRFTDVLPATIDATAEALVTLATELAATGANAGEVEKALAPLVARIAELRETAAGVDLADALALGPEQALEVLERLRQQTVDQLPADSDTSAPALALRARLKQIDDAIAKVNLQIWETYRKQAEATGDVLDNTLEASTVAVRTKATTAETVSEVAKVARGAIGVAQAFGLASDSTAALLQNLVTVADTLPGVIDQVNKIGKNDPDTGKPLFDSGAFAAGLTGVLGGLAGIASSLFGGESPAARRAREISQENTEAIRKLSEEIGNLDLNIRGRDFAAGQRGTEELLRRRLELGVGGGAGSLTGRLDRDDADRILRGQGSSFRELQELAQGLGVTLNTDSVIHFVQSLRELQEAIAATEIAQFAETFAGQMQALNDEFALFDITDPLEQLEKLQELSQQTDRNGELLGSPAIAEALKDLDLTTQAGRDEAEKRLQELLRQARAGELTAEDLGLSLEEFRDLLKQIEGLIDDVNKDRGMQTGGGPIQETFGEFRGLTEETGSVIGGRLLSLDIHVLEGVGYQREMRDILARVFTATGPVPVPVLPATATAPGGLTVVIEQLVLPVAAGTTGPALQAAGTAVGAGLLDAIDQQLGSRYRLKQLLIGQTRVT